MPNLSRKRERERLAVRHTPYFQRSGWGAFVGFRRRPDTWPARFRTRDAKQSHKFLGGHLEFDEAKRQAETWLAQLAGCEVRSVKRSTVHEALEAPLADLRRHGRPDTALRWLVGSEHPRVDAVCVRTDPNTRLAKDIRRRLGLRVAKTAACHFSCDARECNRPGSARTAAD